MDLGRFHSDIVNFGCGQSGNVSINTRAAMGLREWLL
jgi:hypothetical protein